MSKIKNSLEKDVKLLFEIGCFRYVVRTWKRFMNPDVENCAEHTLRVMWVALTLAKHENNPNHEKIMKMALFHDMPESRTGDVDYISRQYTKRNETQAALDIFGQTIHSDELALLEEYEKRESAEARIVKDADTIEVELELVELQHKGNPLGTIWNKDRRENVFPKLYTKSAQKIWKMIHQTNPHSWHLEGRNRFTSGDWLKGGK